MAGASRTPLRITWALAAVLSMLALAAPSAARAGLRRVGPPPSLPRDAIVTGRLGTGTVLHVTVTLEPRHPAALAAYARAVATPGSSLYRAYLTPQQFAQRFGAGAAVVATVQRALRARGLDPGRPSAGSLSIPVTATAGQLERGLSLSLLKLALPGRRSAVAATASPALDAAAAGAVQSIVGLDTASAPRPLLQRAQPELRSGLSRTHVVTGGPQPCHAARTTAVSQGAHTTDQIASAYGFSGLYGAGDEGAGITIAVYELEPVDPGDIAQYQICYGTHAPITYVPVDGGVGTGAGSGEAALDIEDLLGLAPAANLIVYQGPNSNSGAPGSGPYDTFSKIINQDRAQVVTVSWGECEAALGPADAAAENSLFQQAAAQGQTIVAAAGDSGSEDCGGGSLLQTQLAVDDPASQPFVTGVGGTTLSALGPRPSESVWNGGSGPPAAGVQAGAGGGGISDLWRMPPSQLDASPALGVLGAGVTGSQCGHPGGYCREVPDVSADADPATGYVIYWNGSGSVPDQMRGWQAIGGTSAAAPVWAALIALADASPRCAGGLVGYAVPALYRAAGAAYAGDFNDVRSGNNDFTQTNGGRFAAGIGYDEASGLGSPNAAALAGTLCADGLRLTNPGPQHSAAQASVTLRLRAGDVRGSAVRFKATRLPPGLSLARTTGRITGRPRRPGTYHVTVIAQDAQDATAGAAFTWSIGSAPRILDAALTGLAQHRPALTFTVVAGRGAPALREFLVTVPDDLQLVSGHGVKAVVTGAARPHFSARAVSGALRIELGRGLRRVRLTLAYPAIRAVLGRQAQARGHGGLDLAVRVLDVGHGTSRLRARVRRTG
jgi:hypothetical protein